MRKQTKRYLAMIGAFGIAGVVGLCVALPLVNRPNTPETSDSSSNASVSDTSCSSSPAQPTVAQTTKPTTTDVSSATTATTTESKTTMTDAVKPKPPTKPKPTKPIPVKPDVDIGKVTPGNITAEKWKDMTESQQEAFFEKYPTHEMTPAEKHNYLVAVVFGGYKCGTPGHCCTDPEHHKRVCLQIEKGCRICGKHDCPALFCKDEDGFTQYDYTKCPEYNIKKDPTRYCQKTGLPLSGSSGTKVCVHVFYTVECPFCGKEIHADECHVCQIP